MEENNRNNTYRSEEAFLQEINTEWDVEEFLAQKSEQTAPQPSPVQPPREFAVPELPEEQIPAMLVQHPRTRAAVADRPKTRPASQKKPKKKQQINYRGWAQLITAALLVVAIIVVLIILIGKITSGGASNEPMETQAVESTQTREEIISELITRADRLASSYDYEGAVSILREYGTDWLQQPELADANSRYQSAQSLLVRWDDVSEVSMLSFHSLIADPARAFDGGSQESYYRDYMVTVSECKGILQELYNKNFILVSIHDLYRSDVNAEQETVYMPAELYLPEGKKPLVLVQDDLNYAPSMTDGNDDGYADQDGDGFASKLLLDANGQPTCEFITADGQTVQGEYDLVPVVEAFIREHPDFSYQGARGILSLSGKDGIFGYHTTAVWEEKLGSASYTAEVNGARKVADGLKDLGWEFASHTYEHISYGDSALDVLAADLRQWKKEVESIVGETDLLMYPSGGGLYAYEGPLFNTIYDNGFRLFCNIDTETTELRFFDAYLRINRTPVGGQWLNGLDEYFNGSKIKDSARK